MDENQPKRTVPRRKRVVHQVATKASGGATAEGLRALLVAELAITDSEEGGLAVALWLRLKGRNGATVVDVTSGVATLLRLAVHDGAKLRLVVPEEDAAAVKLPLCQTQLALRTRPTTPAPGHLHLVRGGPKPSGFDAGSKPSHRREPEDG